MLLMIPLAAWLSACQSGAGLSSGQKVQDDVYAVADGSSKETPAANPSSGNSTLDSYLGNESTSPYAQHGASSNRGLSGSKYDQYRDDYWLTPAWRPGLGQLDPFYAPLSGGSRWSLGMNSWGGLGLGFGCGPLNMGFGNPWMGGMNTMGWGMNPYAWNMSPWGDPFWNGGMSNPYWNMGWSNPMWSTGWGNPWSGSMFSPWSTWGNPIGYQPGFGGGNTESPVRTTIPVSRDDWGRGYLPTNSGFSRGGIQSGRGQQPIAGARSSQVPIREIDNQVQPTGRNRDWASDNQPAPTRNERGSFWRELFSGDEAPAGRSRNTESFPSRSNSGGWSQPSGGGGFSSPRGGGGGGSTSRPR